MTTQLQTGTAVTIGFFDGVHRGHQALLAATRAAASRLGVAPVAVTFDLHRLAVLGHRGPQPTIMTTDEKVAHLRAAGMAEVVVLHFTPEFAQQTGRQFVDRFLVGELSARWVVVGHDFRCGHGRATGEDELRRYLAAHDAGLTAVDAVLHDGERVSSKAIRAHLLAGEVEAAAGLLGRPYALSGPVEEGRRLGRTLGFPTANVALDPRKLLPAPGVYAVRVGALAGVANLGVRPTVDDSGRLSLEVHLFDFDGDLYGRELTVAFVARLRGERRFDGLPALRAQLARDCAAARAALGKLGVGAPQGASPE